MERVANELKPVTVLRVMVDMWRHVEWCVPCRGDLVVIIDRPAILPAAGFEPDDFAVNDEAVNGAFAVRPNLDAPPNDVTAPGNILIPAREPSRHGD